MPGKVFLDSNFLDYAIETGGPDPEKSAKALTPPAAWQAATRSTPRT
jgi:hypothetical protein